METELQALVTNFCCGLAVSVLVEMTLPSPAVVMDNGTG